MFFGKKEEKKTQTVAVRGIEKGVGTTHVSICLANSLAILGYRVALLEWNNHADFVEIEKVFAGYGYEEASEKVFRIRKVRYYKGYQEKGLAPLKKEGFDYIIADMGTGKNPYFAEVDYPILLVNGCEWKAAKYLTEMKKTAEIIGDRLHILINYGSEEERKEFKKKYQGRMTCFPFWKNAFGSNKEQREWIRQIVSDK